MDTAPIATPVAQGGAVHFAKAALRRLALAKIEPTPENYARAYAAESGHRPAAASDHLRALLARLATQAGVVAAQRDTLVSSLISQRWSEAERVLSHGAERHAAAAQGWNEVIQRLASGLERGSRLWTVSRRKDSLRRVLAVGGGDAERLQQRMRQLLAAWESEAGEAALDTVTPPLPDTHAPGAASTGAARQDALPLVLDLQSALCASLPENEPRATELAAALAQLAQELAGSGLSSERASQCEQLSQRARRMLAHRHHLFGELARLCTALTQGLSELAEDGSWAQGQCEAIQTRLADGVNLRNVRAASDILAQARARQAELRDERKAARETLKTLIQSMLSELDSFGEHTGRFHEKVGRHAEAIARADSLESLAGLVRDMVEESREVQTLVSRTQGRLQAEQARVGEMQQRVQTLEGELRRLSDEVSTDALTQVANRRGLAQAFEHELARLRRATAEAVPCGLAVGLIDIDNFKKLNDSLGHAAGDVALQSLAARVREQLRPQDTVARFGGEEFVVLLPDTAAEEAQQVLSRLQRELTAGLFMHEQREVFVTFSGGVTALREGETLEAALERADEALYEAKRTGKNRTCLG